MPSTVQAGSSPLYRWLIALALVLLVVISGGTWFYSTQENQLRQRAENELRAIETLKVRQITTWRAERLGDAAVLSASPFLAAGVAQWLANPQDDQTEEILTKLRSLQENYQYADVLLVDTRGVVRLSLNGQRTQLPDLVAQALREALRTQQPVMTDLHTGPNIVRPHLELVAPLFLRKESAPEAIGAMVLQVDASQYLYPLIQSWPVPSSSAETLLVRRDGDAVLFLNELRFQSDTALKLRLPLDQTDLPAAMVVQGQEDIVRGKDYRGVEVLAALQAIPDTPWFMIAKEDTAEIFADWYARAALIAALLGVLAVGVGAVAGFGWQRQQKATYRTLLRSEQKQLESEARYRSLFENMLNGLAFHQMLYDQGQPQDYIFLEVNQAFLQQTGLKDVIGKRVTEVIPGIRESDPQLFARYGRVALSGQPEAFETYVQSLDMWFSVSVYSPEKNYFATVFENITERKRAEDGLRQANRAYRTLSDGNQALLRAEDEAALLQDLCRAVVDTGGYRLAWIGFADHDTEKTLRPVASAGHEAGYLERTRITWANTERGRGPAGRAIRSGTPVVVRHIASDPDFEPWRKDALERGYASTLALPIIVAEQVIGVLAIYASEPDAFHEQEMELLEEMVRDLSYGIGALRVRGQHQHTLEVLAQERHLLRTLIDHLPDLIYVKDTEGRFLLKNKADALNMGAESPEETVGKTDFDYYPRELAERFRIDDQQVMQSGQPLVNREEMLVNSSNAMGWVLTTKVPLRDARGEVVGLVGIGRDISERKQAEQAIQTLNADLERRVEERTAQLYLSIERSEAILSSTSDVMIICQVDQTIEQVNLAFEPMFRCKPEDTLSRPLNVLAIPAHTARLDAAFSSVIATLEATRLEITAGCKDGATFEADIMLSPVMGQTEGLLGVVCSVRDITARKQVEAGLRAALEQERELNALRAGVISTVSHEFRTPLAAISSSTQLLMNYAKRMSEDKKAEHLSTILNQVARLTELLSDTLIVSRAETVGLEFRPAPLDVDMFCREMVREAQFVAGDTHQIVFDSDGPCEVMLDEKLLRQIIGNLLSNAVKYSPPGNSVFVNLRCGDQVVIRVRDEGIGIPEEDQAHLFETFFRARNVGMAPGTGLGTAIVKRAVEAHGGTVTFESTLHQGTTFTVTLPKDTSD